MLEVTSDKTEIAEKCNISRRQLYRYIEFLEKFKEMYKDVSEHVKKLREEKPEPKEPKEPQQTKEEKREERRYVGTGISEVMKVLGREYAEIISTVTERTKWFTEALVKIGWSSTMMAFQFARVEPKDIPRKVGEFEDADKFVDFVNRNLYAMIQASTDAVKAIIERDEKIRKYEDAIKLMAMIIKAQRKAVSELSRRMQIAQAILTRYGLLEEFMFASAQYSVLEALTVTSEKPPTSVSEAFAQKAEEEVRRGG
jgi:predicted hydrocarbon binding protein